MPDEAGGNMKETKPSLPRSVGLWTGPDSPRMVNAHNIFDYMDGAGELYIGYCFDHLESYEYKAKTQKSILVELYFMKTSDDAFGLLSLDWGGEPVELSQASHEKASPDDPQWPRALYGEGLLRIWSDTLYARIMAYQETPESKQAVMSLGSAVVNGRQSPQAPELIMHIPNSFRTGWELRTDRASYFRSHLVLNSLYYLSQENILDLDLATEGVTAPYEKESPSGGKTRIRLILVRYPDPKQAAKALMHFHRAYLTEHPFEGESASSEERIKVFPVEDGWLGYKLKDRTLTLIFECPDQETVRAIIDPIK